MAEGSPLTGGSIFGRRIIAPASGKIAVHVINHDGDEGLKIFGV
jgi:hypothetical protein